MKDLRSVGNAYLEIGVSGSAELPMNSILPLVSPAMGPMYGFLSFGPAGQSERVNYLPSMLQLSEEGLTGSIQLLICNLRSDLGRGTIHLHQISLLKQGSLNCEGLIQRHDCWLIGRECDTGWEVGSEELDGTSRKRRSAFPFEKLQGYDIDKQRAEADNV